MANKICYIVGSGVFDGRNFAPRTADFIIAADGGYRYLERMDIMPDLIMGDFDSLGKIPNHPNVITHPTEKDDTDLMLAVKYAMEHGFKIFCIFGCMGGRTDMSIATMQTLCYILNNGCTGYVFGENSVVTGVHNGQMFFGTGRSGTISVFAYGGKAEGVNIKGLRYTMEDGTIESDIPIGVSNEFVGTPASVSVKKGTLIITLTNAGFRREFFGRQ